MYELTIKNVSVELEETECKTCEGLLKFTVWKDHIQVDDVYCTRVPTDITPNEAAEILSAIYLEVSEPAMQGHSIKEICERLSRIDRKANY